MRTFDEANDGAAAGAPSPPPWPLAIRRYVMATAVLHLAWEILQLPLYAIAAEPLPRQAFAVVHCGLGDVMIATLSLVIAVSVLAPVRWPLEQRMGVLLVTLLLGVAYTVFSEWLNVSVRGSWAYGPGMPALPVIGTGLTPLLQWVILPPLALSWSTRVSWGQTFRA